MTHLGCIKSPQDDRDWKYEALPLLTATLVSLPKTFDLRPHLTPVRDQGVLGTCAAFSASCIKEYHEKIDNPSHFNGYMSPFSIYCNRVNKPQEGMHLRDVMKILNTQGTAREELFPYSNTEPKTIPSPVVQDALRFKISGYAQISTIDAAKKALMISGPLLVAFPYYENGLPELARLNHPNILRVFDFTDYGRWPHLVIELVDGQPLDRLIRDRRVLPTEEALPLICQAAEALGYAHETLGVVHCDLKPENILLTRDLQVKLADFGLAKSTLSADTNRLFANGAVAGTPSYIAPEQVQGGRAACDHRSDIYSLGATLYHAVTGRTPFNDPDPVQLMVKRLSEAPIPPHLVNPKVERRISQFIMSMMARDPANRMQSWDEVLELLGDLLETLAPSTDRYRGATEGENKVIRRRTSFWNYVPNRLFRRASTDAKDVG